MLWPQEHPRTFCSGVVRRGGGLARVGELRGFLWERNATDRGGLEWKEQSWRVELNTQVSSQGSVHCSACPSAPGDEPTRDGRIGR